MKGSSAFLMFFVTLFIGGCAHVTRQRGIVAMKVSDTEAHISLGQGEVEEGDRIAFFRNQCFHTGNVRIATEHSHCNKVKAGEGRVAKVLSDQYSVVRVEPGAVFDEKTEVEKINKGGAE